jgi:hypothetical protein
MRRPNVLTLSVAFALVQLANTFVPALAEDSPATSSGAQTPALHGQLDNPSPPAASQQASARSSQTPSAAGKVKLDRSIAYSMARDPWLYKTAAADPSVLESICKYAGAAKLLAKNRHLGDLAESDHYLCRRLTRWRGATLALVRNPQADRVIALDPEGIYRAIDLHPSIAYVLAKNIMFHQMITENPDLGKFIASHM